jgi:hypothetical protein
MSRIEMTTQNVKGLQAGPKNRVATGIWRPKTKKADFLFPKACRTFNLAVALPSKQQPIARFTAV